MDNFKELNLLPELLQAIDDLNFERPMPVQVKVIPELIKNISTIDMIVLAQTGTGKTAAFGLPIIQSINAKTDKLPQALVICPTRELCIQVAEDITTYSKYLPHMKVAAVFGGASIDRQIRLLRDGVQIIVATPGRLLDLIRRKETNLSKLSYVVLDEADEMLKMGFREELEAILDETPNNKSTLLFSATMPDEIKQITKKYLKNPTEITIGEKNIGAEGVIHHCFIVHAKDRYLALKRIVDYYPEIYGIIFCRTRKETQEVADHLMKDQYNAEPLHGDLSQTQRETVMQKFRNKHISLLIATDVAARGLDVDNLTHIINYNIPDELEIYTHRSGRTGRAGKKGTSIIISNLKEKGKIKTIEKIIKKQIEIKKVYNAREICEKQLFHMIDKMTITDVNEKQMKPYYDLILKKLEWFDREELIKKFVSVEFNRFLDYYKDARDLNIIEKNNTQEHKTTQMSRFFINLGSKDKIKPPDIIGIINDTTKTKHIKLGKIEIKNVFSFFEADSKFKDIIVKSNTDGYFKERKVVIEEVRNKKQDKNHKDNNKKSYRKQKK